jgi:hypothetical protein
VAFRVINKILFATEQKVMGDRAAKNARAKARKQKFLEVENQIQALQHRISTSAKSVRAKSEHSKKKPERRNSVAQFFHEMFDSEAALDSATKKKQQRRGSGTVVQGNKIVVHDKRGRKIAEFPVHKKTERIADNDSANPANQTEFAKALRRVRNQMIPGDEEDEFDDDVRADRYARDESGAIKEKCTTLQKIFGLKCDKVKLTQEERERNLAHRKHKAAAERDMEKTVDEEMFMNISRARLREELDNLKLGRKRVSLPTVSKNNKKNTIENIPVLTNADRKPGIWSGLLSYLDG